MKHQSMLFFLHRLTAPVPFPVAEALAALLPPLAILALLRRRPAALLRGVLALLGLLALLWGPACAAPVEALPLPDAAGLARLCEDLIDALNAAPLAFPDPARSLALAPAAAGLPGCAVKAVRHPGWMGALRISGLFVPLTGEALADPTAPAPLIPFTAVHELMHLTGIADEGAANIAAWEKCLAAGDAFADSARLWALRYALGLLQARDPSAWTRCRQKMEGTLLRAFDVCGGEMLPDYGSYVRLIGYLARA